MFSDVYRNRRVLVTGHTGFKGSWLTAWLLRLGADVAGISIGIPTKPSMFEELGLAGGIRHYEGDIRDLSTISKVINQERPEFVFHLAAQAIVSVSYTDPVETVSTNVIGTMNVLEALRSADYPCVAVLITSDKCYDNVEWVWGYRETDRLGGRDVYSGSKGAAELVIKSYLHSFFKTGQPVCLAVGRAGNVIGGGDWAKDRIVADCARAWSEGRPVDIRNPMATRPWQHVLEPLSGYLALGGALVEREGVHGEAFNFGPRAEQNQAVSELLADLGRQWGFNSTSEAYRVAGDGNFHEAGLLKLNCDKALSQLKWEPTLSYVETMQMVADWYKAYYQEDASMHNVTMNQIMDYERLAAMRGRSWAISQ